MKERQIINYIVTAEGRVDFSSLTEEEKRKITEQLCLALDYRFLEGETER